MNKEIKRLNFWIRDSKLLSKDMIFADKTFTNFSERGVKPDFSKLFNPLRFHQLQDAKKIEGWHIDMYEQGILEGSTPYWTLLGGENPKEILPFEVVNFLSKQLFKGMDKELILKLYQEILNYWTWWRRLLFKVKII